jgi:hypothetical protein
MLAFLVHSRESACSFSRDFTYNAFVPFSDSDDVFYMRVLFILNHHVLLTIFITVGLGDEFVWSGELIE